MASVSFWITVTAKDFPPSPHSHPSQTCLTLSIHMLSQTTGIVRIFEDISPLIRGFFNLCGVDTSLEPCDLPVRAPTWPLSALWLRTVPETSSTDAQTTPPSFFQQEATIYPPSPLWISKPFGCIQYSSSDTCLKTLQLIKVHSEFAASIWLPPLSQSSWFSFRLWCFPWHLLCSPPVQTQQEFSSKLTETME